MSYKSVKSCIRSMENEPDLGHVVTVFNCNDQLVCEFCKSLEGEHYNEAIYNLPQAPFKNCTDPDGCRCWMAWTYAFESPRKDAKPQSTKRSSFLDKLRGR